MRVMLAETFFDGLLDLPARDRDRAIKAVQQMKKDYSHPSLNLHPVKEASSNFYTARISKEARLVVHLSKDVILICHAAKHDDAYHYAKSRKLRKGTDGAEIISIADIQDKKESYTPPFLVQEDVDQLTPPQVDFEETETDEVPLFLENSDADLLQCGATEAVIPQIREIISEQQLFMLETQMSARVHDNLIALYLGDPIPHPAHDEQSEEREADTKFIEFDDTEEVLAALNKPWERWLVFLSPTQRQIVKSNYTGASKVFGGAGTGKTVVALHRAKRLAETERITTPRGVGLLTFSKVLADDLDDKADLLMGSKSDTRNNVFVSHLDYLAHEALTRDAGKTFELTTEYTIKSMLTELLHKHDLVGQFTPEFAFSEYMNVVGPWGLVEFDKYKNFQRLGRQTPLQAKQRELLANLYTEFEKACYEKGLITYFQLYQRAAESQKGRGALFDHVILDETQDLGPHMLAFVRSLVTKKRNDIMLCGDTGQSLYTRHHSFRKHGFDVQGRSKKLFVNYRTSRQIKETADKVNDFLLELSDEPDENRRSISIFNGPKPKVKLFSDRNTEIEELIIWVKKQIERGVQPHEIVVLTPNEYAMSAAALEMSKQKIRCWKLDATANYLNGEVGLAVVRRVKGLEYRSVAIIGCDEDQFPNAEKLNELGDGSDFDEFLTLEKNSLYVAMTRARDNLLCSGISTGSTFLEELN
jgi:superfamily I DNA/RNA helicase/mRNA-degrading endonuclease RelE of RelBE toxin-antitoxin system